MPLTTLSCSAQPHDPIRCVGFPKPQDSRSSGDFDRQADTKTQDSAGIGPRKPVGAPFRVGGRRGIDAPNAVLRGFPGRLAAFRPVSSGWGRGGLAGLKELSNGGNRSVDPVRWIVTNALDRLRPRFYRRTGYLRPD
jgi:hypothetical protein